MCIRGYTIETRGDMLHIYTIRIMITMFHCQNFWYYSYSCSGTYVVVLPLSNFDWWLLQCCKCSWEGYESGRIVITHEKGVKVWEWEHRELNQEKWVSHKYFVKIVMFYSACVLLIYVENQTQLPIEIGFTLSSWTYQASLVNSRKGPCPSLVGI